MSKARDHLRRLAARWDEKPRGAKHDFHFRSLVDGVLFHADLRFRDYLQYRDNGEFPERLRKWLENVGEDRQKKVLFRMLDHLLFVDRAQMLSLHLDAYRRIVVPWVTSQALGPGDALAPDYDVKVVEMISKCSLFSITESFVFPDFIRINSLSGLPRITLLGEDPRKVDAILPSARLHCAVVLEDFVGTGKQAKGVLIKVRDRLSESGRALFVPLVALEVGLSALRSDPELERIEVEPVLVIPSTNCVRKKPSEGEPTEFPQFRGLVKVTGKRVIERLNKHDDAPADPFGYQGSGALLVTSHNTPNNTLPLIHHRSPTWFPLFRRVHHVSKDGLR